MSHRGEVARREELDFEAHCLAAPNQASLGYSSGAGLAPGPVRRVPQRTAGLRLVGPDRLVGHRLDVADPFQVGADLRGDGVPEAPQRRVVSRRRYQRQHRDGVRVGVYCRAAAPHEPLG